MDEDEESESSSSVQETSPNCVVRALKELSDIHRFSQTHHFWRYDKHLCIDRVDWKRKTLNDLQTGLLPLIKPQISILLSSLDLTHLAIHACPHPELTIQIISVIKRTLHQTRSAVELLALREPLPAPSRDHHLGQHKCYRSLRLVRATKELIQEDLCYLFEACALLIWGDENNDHEDLDYEAHASERRQEVMTLAAESQNQVDELIEGSKLSDFDIIQHRWRLASDNLTEALQFLGEMTNRSYSITSRNNNNNNNQDGHQIFEDGLVEDEERNRSADHRERVNRLAKSFIPFVKLGRIFYDKLSKTTTNRPPFRLDTEMSSDELELLADRTSWIESSIDDLMGELSQLHKSSENLERRISWMRNEAVMPLCELDRILRDLSRHMIPVHTTTSTAYSITHAQSHFKTWFRPLKKQFWAACGNFLQTINICFGDLVGETSESESEEDEDEDEDEDQDQDENENDGQVEDDPIP
ncbi:hypothetical protein PGT21_036269 [Puccinia graminis f. sp. tritici]|uniref:Uncharacterized protein n=1 Tax=Puccinia graminis f. sp. tritici TaxID=56615 RepID=A0A5B0PN77_PUCGR|nr:hypothetical protein PGT21_036269 [Puccinia graminis f. sp. tritici]